MSMLDVLRIAAGAVEDDATGISARVTLLRNATGLEAPTAFRLGKWALREHMTPATEPQLIIRPAAGLEEARVDQQQREGIQSIAVSVELFNADEAALQDAIALWQLALVQVFDGIREYSDGHQGTIIEVSDPISTRYGEFTGSATSGGFISTINLRERSTL